MKSRTCHWITRVSSYLNLSWFHLRGIQLRYILELTFLWAPCAHHWQWEHRGPRYRISLWHLSRGIVSCRICPSRVWLRKVVSLKWHTYTLSHITGGNNKLAVVLTPGFIWFQVSLLYLWISHEERTVIRRVSKMDSTENQSCEQLLNRWL